MAAIAFLIVILGSNLQIAFANSYMPKPPLARLTDDRRYSITINWEPDPVKSYPYYNDTTTFSIEIADRFGEPAANKTYSFTIKSSNSTIIKEFRNETTDDKGHSRPFNIDFLQSEPIIVTVCVPARLSCADFNIVVTPEFPATHAILLMVGTIATSILILRKGHLTR